MTIMLDRPPEPVGDITRRDLLRGVGTLGAGWVLAGCGNPAENETGEVASATRTVDDYRGRAVEVPATPMAVVPLDGTILGAVVALRVPLAAVPDEADAQLGPVADQLPDNFDLAPIPRYGGQYEPDIEAIAAATPDLIVGTEFNEDLYERLAQVAPTVLVAYGSNGGWRQRFLAVASALGRDDRATEVEAAYEAVLVELPARLADLRVAFVRPQDDGQFRIDSEPAAFPGSVAEDAGIPLVRAPEGIGELAEGSGFVTVSGERIDVLSEADLIVVPDFRADGDEQDGLTQFAANPLWDQLSAVEQGRVLQAPGFVYNGGNHYAATQLLRDLVEATS